MKRHPENSVRALLDEARELRTLASSIARTSSRLTSPKLRLNMPAVSEELYAKADAIIGIANEIYPHVRGLPATL